MTVGRSERLSTSHDSLRRIYIVKFWSPPPVQILSCSFWEILAKSYVGAPRGVPPPRRNPGSATDSWKIRTVSDTDLLSTFLSGENSQS